MQPPLYKTARARAYALYEAACGAISTAEISRVLLKEGYGPVRPETISMWRLRGEWATLFPKVTVPAKLVVKAKVEKVARLDSISHLDRLAAASGDIPETTISLAGKLRAGVEGIEPEEIQIRDVAGCEPVRLNSP